MIIWFCGAVYGLGSPREKFEAVQPSGASSRPYVAAHPAAAQIMYRKCRHHSHLYQMDTDTGVAMAVSINTDMPRKSAPPVLDLPPDLLAVLCNAAMALAPQTRTELRDLIANVLADTRAPEFYEGSAARRTADAVLAAFDAAGVVCVPVEPTAKMKERVHSLGGPQALAYALAAYPDLLGYGPYCKED